jgi:putative photosynthetic complex assembly protein
MTQLDAQHHVPGKSYDKEMIPRILLRAMLALVLSVLALVTYARLTDMPLSATPPVGAVVVERTILLTGELSGAATIRETDGTLIADMSPEEGGFVSGIYRVLVRERTKHRVALDSPVILRRQDNGRVSIHDPSTGWSADLMGFGIDNARVFARLLD